MKITDFIQHNRVYLDGAMGTLLQEAGLMPGELPERWNITHPEVIQGIHKAYYDAGSHIVSANTFGANSLKFSDEELEEIIKAAISHVKAAQKQSTSSQEKWVAVDIGPTGRMLAPYGDFGFEEAVSVFAKTVKLAEKYGADLIFIQTMNDSYETKAALLAAKENSSLPVFVGNAYGEDGKLMTGATPSAMVAMAEGMGADAVGVNCSLGPKALEKVVLEYLEKASVPVFIKPNAGLPTVVDGKTVFDILPKDFAKESKVLIEAGVGIAGGCCGTSPAYIEELVAKTHTIPLKPIVFKEETCVSSYTHTVTFGHKPVLIGERINPTGKKPFKEALIHHDIDYILKEGIGQQEKGVHLLDVNVGLPEIDEVSMLEKAVYQLQSIINLPLQIDTANPVAMEKALRLYNGKAMVNSVNGKQESMDAVFPLVKKYGGVVVALTLDETGIPPKGEDRVKIAKRILAEAEKYGIHKKDIIFDPLALTVSADTSAGKETLKAVSLIRNELGCHTSLGVSNVSFGLPKRDFVNSTFFAMALSAGLSAAIMNPYSDAMMGTYYAYSTLSGQDENCEHYIRFAKALPEMMPTTKASGVTKEEAKEHKSKLQYAIVKGLCDESAVLTTELLKTVPPLTIIHEEIIPALDIMGVGFENKTVYLPQLLMSAEAAKSAFEEIKKQMPQEGAAKQTKIVLATVKGDIHDIGKNIVKLLLQNYGFSVYDLGRDVPPETVLKAARDTGAQLIGLSALMTTTVPAMEETVRLIKEAGLSCRIVVGGAVLTREYADKIGADFYAKDAMETVRCAESVEKSI